MQRIGCEHYTRGILSPSVIAKTLYQIIQPNQLQGLEINHYETELARFSY